MPTQAADSGLSVARSNGRTVLVVEDDAEIRDALAEVLTDEGYTVRVSSDGREALERLRAGETADLLLLDLMMPAMDGWAFRVAQKRDARLAAIPVIAISADTGPKAAAIDADAYLPKPVSCDVLLGAVERVLTAADRRREQAAVAERERLAALGTLAAGIAHEINNPLAFVRANLELLATLELARNDSTGDDESGAALEAAITGCDRIGTIVRDMQLCSRPPDASCELVDVRRVLDSAGNIVTGQLRGRGRLVKEYEEVPCVEANVSRLGQVFLNLLVNAAQAIPEGQPSRHQLRVAVRHDVPTGTVVIEVSDTGHGVPDEIRAKIFEPFFTTKAIGSGTGLGLSIVHRLVSEMRGDIAVESSPGQGSTFRVRLPVACPAASPAQPAEGGARASARSTSRARVLVVDDEPAICHVLARFCGTRHEVEETTDPDEAIRRVESGARFDVILCDMVMPGKRGSDVHDAILAIAPDQAARMVFLTGGAIDERAGEFLASKEPMVLEKPFASAALFAKIDDVLARFDTSNQKA